MKSTKLKDNSKVLDQIIGEFSSKSDDALI